AALRESGRFQVVHAAAQRVALDDVVWKAETKLPVGCGGHAREVRAGGRARYMDALRVAAEKRCVAVYPRDRPAHLVGHHEEVAAAVWRVVEIQCDIMRTCADEHLGGGGVFPGASRAPRPAVHEDLDRGSAAGGIDVELLVGPRAVGEALRLAQAPARRLGSEVAAFE